MTGEILDVDRLLRYPAKHVTGLMDDPDDVAAAVDDLVRAGFDGEHVRVLCGEIGAQRLDPAGRHHGLWGRLVRFAQYADEEHEVWQRYATHMANGGFAVAVPAPGHEEAETAAHLLRAHGGHDLVHFGAAHWEPLGPETAALNE